MANSNELLHVEITLSASSLDDLQEQIDEIRGRMSEGAPEGTNATLQGGKYWFRSTGAIERVLGQQ